MWMYSAGFKPVQTEVPVADSWVADVSGYITPTFSELKRNLKILKPLGFKDTADGMTNFYNRYQFPLTGLVEVKTTMADFQKDVGRKYERYGNCQSSPCHLSWIALPKGVVEERELPSNWGWIFFGADGTKLLKVYPPKWVEAQHPGDTAKIIAAIGERVFNKYHYREFREWIKQYRAEKRQNNERYKTGSVLSILENRLAGKSRRSLSDDFRAHGLPLTAQQSKRLDEIEEQLVPVHREEL